MYSNAYYRKHQLVTLTTKRNTHFPQNKCCAKHLFNNLWRLNYLRNTPVLISDLTTPKFFSSPPLCKNRKHQTYPIRQPRFRTLQSVNYSVTILVFYQWPTFHLHRNNAVTKHNNLTYHLHNRGYVYSFNVTLSTSGFSVNTAPPLYCERMSINLTVLCRCTPNLYSCSHHANHYIFLFQKYFH